jgi:diguanylate cyclase (GGDEF)-like protein
MMNDDEKSLILMVDDNQQNLQVLGNLLKKNGYKPVAALNGPNALEFAQSNPPELILLDILMPEMDGIETCRRLKEQELTKNIPVIFITALSDTKDKLKAFHAGGVDYVTKPFVQEEVLARINVHLKLKKALEKLEKMSVTDEMTGVFNRRFAYEILAKQIEMAKRERSSFVVCYIDIDCLKTINDTYGHAEGDILINTVVNSLKRVIRASDYIFRMGGDEFLLIFPKAKLTDSDNLIERLRKQLNHQNIHGFSIDFSFGFSEFHAEDNLSPDDLIKRADSKMYKTKMSKKTKLQ